ncbi:uncharacterized protein HaLaN_24152 [Haematococcus lacustris]|uniref:RRM domain-containing protein n=1 Tax=Haematococcus lacustris TaxID=44745 RepID=A0A699ZT80_HAELA|nr:uncharacterized protein HaLaN_24152 [Haematococcus lacustris]
MAKPKAAAAKSADNAKAKKDLQKAVKQETKKKPVVEEDSDDSDDDDDSDVPAPAVQKPTAKAKKQKAGEGKAVPKAAAPATPAEGASTSCFVGNMAWASDENSIKAHFKSAGKVMSVRIVTDRETGRPRGFGYVEFADAAAAAKAAKTLNGSDMDGRQIKVEVATPRAAPAGGSGGGDPEGTTVFIKGFDTSQAEDDIKAALEEAFGECGEIKSIRLPSDRESGTLKGIG